MTKWLKPVLAGGLTLLFLVLLTATPQAQDDKDGVIKYRQHIMKSLSAHAGASGDILKNRLSYPKHLAVHAQALHNLSKLLPDLFPAGTDQGMTDAKSNIWSDGADFRDKAGALEAQTAKLMEAAASGNMGAFGAQMANVGKACKGCHKEFRKPKAESYKNR